MALADRTEHTQAHVNDIVDAVLTAQGQIATLQVGATPSDGSVTAAKFAASAFPLQLQAPWQSGRYYWIPSVSNTSTLATLGNGTMRAFPFFVPSAATLSRIGAEVTSAGDVGSKVRLGIYNDDGTGRPGTLVIDAGTIAGDSVAVQEITIAQALGPGFFWAAGVVQLVTVTQPTVRTQASGPIYPTDAGVVIPSAAQVSAICSVTGITGALPATFGAPSVGSASGPRIFVKVA